MKKIIQILSFTILIVTLSSCGVGKNENNTQKIQKTKQEEISKKIEEETKENIKEISQKILDGNMTEKEAQKAMEDSLNNSKTFKNQLEKSKFEMPRMLKLLKANKKCLTDADSKIDAKNCEEEAKKLAKELGIYDTMYRDIDDSQGNKWSEEIKKEVLRDINEGIKQLEKMLPCVKKAKTMTDMMVCGKDNN